MLLFFIIAALIIAILAIVFAIQNANIVLVSFLLWKFEGSLALVLLLTFVLGFIAGLLIILPKLIKRNLKASDQKKKPEEPQKISGERNESKDATQREQIDKNI